MLLLKRLLPGLRAKSKYTKKDLESILNKMAVNDPNKPFPVTKAEMLAHVEHMKKQGKSSPFAGPKQ